MNVRQRALSFLALCMMAVSLMPPQASAGGWAVATVDELPADVVRGEELVIHFTMRQHGVQLTNWGEVFLTFTHVSSHREITVSASADPETWKYTARVTFPQEGLWRWTAGDGIPQPMGTISVAPSMKSLDSWVQAESKTGLDTGRQLFLAKGCAVCHSHPYVADLRAETLGELASFNAGPDLSDYAAVPEYLALWLADPRSVRSDAQMPDLGLDDDEIQALIEFLSTE